VLQVAECRTVQVPVGDVKLEVLQGCVSSVVGVADWGSTELDRCFPIMSSKTVEPPPSAELNITVRA